MPIADERAAPGPDEPRPDLGVLFVHGIGEQRQGETLVKFADPLTRWLARWLTRGRRTEPDVGGPGGPEGAGVFIDRTVLVSGDEPAGLQLTIEPGEFSPAPQRWLLAESWWAETFRPPKTTALLLWLLLVLPYMLLVQFYEQFRRARRRVGTSKGERLARGGRIAVFGLAFAAALPLAAVAVVVVAALFVGLLVPIPAIAERAKKIALLLSNSLGDCFVLTSSTVQFDAMASRVAADLAKLSEKVERVAVVAHSQGTAVGYHAIARHGPPANMTAFVTVGEALKKLDLIRGLQTFGDPRVPAGRHTSISKLIGRWLRLKTLRFALSWLGLAGVFLVGLSLPQFLVLFSRWEVPSGQALGLAGGGLLIAGLVYVACDRCWRDDFASAPDPLQIGEQEVRWADFYASADPVSNGPLFDKPEEKPWLHQREVWNYASIVRDHTTYTSSEDDFLGCLVKELFRASGISVRGETVEAFQRARWRGWWRVWCLTFARFLAAVAAAVGIVRIWGNLHEIGHRLIGWSPGQPFHPLGKALVATVRKFLIVGQPGNEAIVGALSVVVVVVAGYAALAAVWSYWQGQDVKRFYRRFVEDTDPDPLGGRELLWFVLTLCLLSAFAGDVAVTGDYASSWNLLTGHKAAAAVVLGVLVLGPVVLARVLAGPMRGLERRLRRRFARESADPVLPPDAPPALVT